MTAQAAFRLLFHRSGPDGVPAGPAELFLRQIGGLLSGGNLPDKLNCLSRHIDGRDFPVKLLGEVFNAFVSCGVLPRDLSGPDRSEDAAFLLAGPLLTRRS